MTGERQNFHTCFCRSQKYRHRRVESYGHHEEYADVIYLGTECNLETTQEVPRFNKTANTERDMKS